MEKYDFCEELNIVFKSNVFTTPTIYAMLTGFNQAIGIEFEKGGKGYDELLFTKKKESNYKVDIAYYNSMHSNKNICLSGEYQNINFKLQCFFNYLQIYSKNIIEIPFTLELETKENENDYKLFLNGYKGETKIIIVRQSEENDMDEEKVTFYLHRMDFENSLGIISSFIQNPGYILSLCQINFATKKVYFTNSEIDDIKYTDELKISENGNLLQKAQLKK